MPVNDEIMYSEDIAVRMGVTVRQARRILIRLENEYPNQFVGNEAGRRFIHRVDFERIITFGADKLSDLHKRIDDLDKRLRQLEYRT